MVLCRLPCSRWGNSPTVGTFVVLRCLGRIVLRKSGQVVVFRDKLRQVELFSLKNAYICPLF